VFNSLRLSMVVAEILIVEVMDAEHKNLYVVSA